VTRSLPRNVEATRALAEELSVRYSREHGLNRQAFAIRLLIHLPRVANGDGDVDPDSAADEALRLIETEEWADEQQLREKWTVSLPQVDLAGTELVPLSDGDAREIFGSLHFLRSFRTGAQYFGLRDARSGSLLSCCGVAPSRWQLVTDALAKSLLIAPGEILDLCRMYTLPGAPRNSISRLLRLLVHESASWSAPAHLLTTVVDQNLGFTGSAYASANWPLLAEVEHLPYRYVDKRYRTAGQLFEQYRTMESAVLAEKLGPSFQQSRGPLRRSLVFGTALNKHFKRAVSRRADLPLLLSNPPGIVDPPT
jgi:hypothetical protein